MRSAYRQRERHGTFGYRGNRAIPIAGRDSRRYDRADPRSAGTARSAVGARPARERWSRAQYAVAHDLRGLGPDHVAQGPAHPGRGVAQGRDGHRPHLRGRRDHPPLGNAAGQARDGRDRAAARRHGEAQGRQGSGLRLHGQDPRSWYLPKQFAFLQWNMISENPTQEHGVAWH